MASNPDRFPRPDFSQGYEYPTLDLPASESPMWQYLDIAILIIALGAMAYFLYRQRSRKAIFALSLLSLCYFGFIRAGCVCPIGSIQIVAQGLFDPSLQVPISTLLSFLIPLIAALLAGRLFCGGVCPLGALQDLVSIKKLAVHTILSRILSFLPPLYLIVSILAALSNSDFLICRYDPFVGFFRLSFPSLSLAIWSLAFLSLSVVVHRPYCRFLCPYGFLLKILGHISFRHASVQPASSSCVNCQLCRPACPQGDISPSQSPPAPSKNQQKKLALALILLVPSMALGWFAGQGWGNVLAQLHRDVQIENAITQGTTPLSTEAEAFLSGKVSQAELARRVQDIRQNWQQSSAFGGLILALIVWISLVGRWRQSPQKEHRMRKGSCLACGRCQSHCPVPASQGKKL